MLDMGSPPTGNGFHVPLGERQLFLDEGGIATLDGLTRAMCTPTKRGAVIRPRPEQGELCLQTRSAPAWDPAAGVFKLWLVTGGIRHSGTTYAESEDGLHWRQPALRQQEVNGSRENNFVTLDPALEWPANALANVVCDPDTPDSSRRFKGLAHCTNREPVVSPDGIHWRRLGVPSIPSDDESNLSYDRPQRRFLATLKRPGPYGRSVFLSVSTDFERWSPPELMFHADAKDQQCARAIIQARLADPTLQQPPCNEPGDYHADIYNMGLFRYEGRYVGMPAVYHATGQEPTGNTDGFHLIQLAASRDLRTWQRLENRRAFIGPSPVGTGAYDLCQLLPPSAPIIRGDELWFYYTGIKYRCAPPNADPQAGAVCLATLRRDGFVSLDAGEQPGTLLTPPFVLPGTRLSANVKASKGALTVEVWDEAGQVVAASAPLRGDLPRGEFAWPRGSLAARQGQTIRLRFCLQHGSLYSYWLEA